MSAIMARVFSAKLTSRFQLTIPAVLRRQLEIEPGDLMNLTVDGGKVLLRAAKEGWTESSRGLGEEVWNRAGGAADAVERERDSWES
jgi:antitoxin PrlF